MRSVLVGLESLHIGGVTIDTCRIQIDACLFFLLDNHNFLDIMVPDHLLQPDIVDRLGAGFHTIQSDKKDGQSQQTVKPIEIEPIFFLLGGLGRVPVLRISGSIELFLGQNY